MKISHRMFATLGLVLFLAPYASRADSPALQLKQGVYVAGQCEHAPNAAILVWNGVGFSGAHSSQCVSKILSRRGSRFRVRTTCSAVGDGSPNASHADFVELVWLNRISDSHFELIKGAQEAIDYRWCAAGAPD
jgi:hypothetical protein